MTVFLFLSYLINLQKHLSPSLLCSYQRGTWASHVMADGWICCQWDLRAIKETLSNDCQGKAEQWTLRFIFAPSQPASQQWNCTSHLCLICCMSIISLSVSKSHETLDGNGTQEMSSVLSELSIVPSETEQTLCQAFRIPLNIKKKKKKQWKIVFSAFFPPWGNTNNKIFFLFFFFF